MKRHLVTKGSFYERLADHGHELVSDEDFAHLYAEGKGRPSVPPSVMCGPCCAPPMTGPRHRDLPADKSGLGLESGHGVDDWFEGIGATTFSLMRARMWPMTPTAPCSKKRWNGRWKQASSNSP